MSSGTRFEPQEIVLTPIRFPNQNIKNRPVLIISKFSKTSTEDTFVCLPITSSSSNEPFAINIKDSDMQGGTFHKPSRVLCQYYFTQLKRGQKRIGKVTPQFYREVKTKIRSEILDV